DDQAERVREDGIKPTGVTNLAARHDQPHPHHPKITGGHMRNQLRPLFDRIVIKELDPDRVRRSGLIVPPGSEEPPPQHGIVLAIGPGLEWWDQMGVAMP